MDVDALLTAGPTSQAELADAVMQNHFSKLYSFACSLLRDADEAEDAVQETVVRAVRGIERYRVGSSFEAWIFRICVNTCRGHLRKRSAATNLVNSLRLHLLPSSVLATPEDKAQINERDAALWKAIQMLDEKYRVPILLKVVHEVPARQIAATLEIAEKTVYTRIYEGFRRLRADLDSRFDHGK